MRRNDDQNRIGQAQGPRTGTEACPYKTGGHPTARTSPPTPNYPLTKLSISRNLNPCDTIFGVKRLPPLAACETAFRRKVESGGKFTLTKRKRV